MQGFVARRILVPVKGSSTDDEAVRLGCRLARRGRARVYVITILVVRRSIALGTLQDAEVDAAEKVLDAAESIGTELDVEVDTELLQAREAGPAIVDEAREWQADLLVAGVPFRERFGEFHMGRTVPYLLKYAPCRMLVLREPAPG